MNRRGFFKTLAAATAGFAILPPATTYERVWKATRMPMLHQGIFRPSDYMGTWEWVSFLDNDGRAIQVACKRIVDMPIGQAPFPHNAGEPLHV